MRTLAGKADGETRPSNPNLRSVPPPVQPLLPEARALKPTTPFVKRLAFVRTGHPDAKCLLLVLGAWCEVYTDGASGRCWPKRDTVRELCEMGSNRFKRAWRMLVESGALTVQRRGQRDGRGLSSMLTINAVPLLERTPGGPINERTPGGSTKKTEDLRDHGDQDPPPLLQCTVPPPAARSTSQDQGRVKHDDAPPTTRQVNTIKAMAEERGLAMNAILMPKTRKGASDWIRQIRELKGRGCKRVVKTTAEPTEAQEAVLADMGALIPDTRQEAALLIERRGEGVQ